MRYCTSAFGRFQFSDEKPNRVRCVTPPSAAALMTLRAAATPWRWPMVRGRPRARAHRPLPSMMMATCSVAAT